MHKQGLAALALLAAGACAATGTTADVPLAASATVQFQRGYAGDGAFGVMSDQEYLVLDSDGMSFHRGALFNFLSGSEPRSRQLPAGQRLTINAITSYADGGYAQCNGRAQFTPIAGHSYTVMQAELRPSVCQMRVIDAATGDAPEDLDIVDDISGRNG